MIPATAAFNARPGAWRRGLGLATVVLAATGAAGLFLLAQDNPAGRTLLPLFFGGIFVISLVANLAHRRT